MNKIEELGKLFDEIRNCQKCYPEKTKFRDIPIVNPKNISSPLMLVGYAPSIHRTESGKTFGAKSNNVFERFLKELGCSRFDVYSTNVCKCTVPKLYPCDPERCIDYLWKEIKIVSPKLCVLFGRDTIKLVLGDDYPLIGKVVHFANYKFITSPHPMSVIRKTISEEALLDVARKIKAEVNRVESSLDAWLK